MEDQNNHPEPEGHWNDKYDFASIEAGGSWFYADQPGGGNSKIAKAAHMYARRHGWVAVKTRKEDNGVRIWRVA